MNNLVCQHDKGTIRTVVEETDMGIKIQVACIKCGQVFNTYVIPKDKQ
jgi:hypothetical protein